ncbi:MAG: radical SAM protein [Desulfurococcaceae archaeon]
MSILVRVSIGTLAVLGLRELKLAEKPRTAYLLQYSSTGCRAGCLFCLQSKRLHSLKGGEYLGRVSWPLVDLDTLKLAWKSVFERVCLQTIIKPLFIKEALRALELLRSFEGNAPISLATTPIARSYLEEAKKLGVDALGIGLDVATKELFEKYDKPYSWDTYWGFISKAVEVYGGGGVYVHLIAGLGESLRDIVRTMKRIYGMGARVALFNYVDIMGRPSVDIGYYRLVQLARYLLELGLDPDEYLEYDKVALTRKPPVDFTDAFYVSGCPGCNRPFYNESPSGPLYNIPSNKALKTYANRLREELASIGVQC